MKCRKFNCIGSDSCLNYNWIPSGRIVTLDFSLHNIIHTTFVTSDSGSNAKKQTITDLLFKMDRSKFIFLLIALLLVVN